MRPLGSLIAVLALGMGTTAAYGDGGTMLLHQDAGPFIVTLFAAPQPLHVGAADFSAMVQDRSSEQVLLDSSIDLTLAEEGAGASSQTVHLTQGQASNRLLQAVTVHIANSGRWRLGLLVRRGNESGHLSTVCIVEPDGSRRMLVWSYILLPLGIILLFVVHQLLKFRGLKFRAKPPSGR